MSEINGHTRNVVLTIVLDASNGGVTVNGPIQDKLLCFGLLEIAKQAVIEQSKSSEQRIVTPNPTLNLLKMKA